jgi:hypothetical protein
LRFAPWIENGHNLSLFENYVAKVPECENPCVVYDGTALDFSDGLRARNFREFEI